jgi:hypothetical protein
MRTLPSSAFFTRLQSDNIEMAELIDLETNGPSFHWTTANNPMTFTLSGTATEYAVFPGKTIGGVRESTDLAVAVVEFVIANSGQVFSDLMVSNDFDMSAIKVGRIFTDTPDMGRMEIFQGKLGDFSYDRDKISGQARSQYGSANTRWPYYNYQDTCVWRFGSTGCGFDVTSVTLALANDSLDTASSTTLNILVASGTLSGSFDNGRFDFGRFTVTDGVNSGHTRTIRAHTGDLLFLSHPLPINSFANMAASVFPGCRKRRITDCVSLYDNAENFLGFEWIPIQEDAF